MNAKQRKLFDASVQSIINEQNTKPVFLTNHTLDVIDEEFMPEVFIKLGLEGSYQRLHGRRDKEFYPLTPAEQRYVREDWIGGPYGGTHLAQGLLWMGKKFLVATVNICFDTSPAFRHSLESYGNAPDSIYESKHVALREASNLAAFLRPKVRPHLVYVSPNDESDRHSVFIMFPASYVTKKFRAYREFAIYVRRLFNGYEPGQSQLPHLIRQQ